MTSTFLASRIALVTLSIVLSLPASADEFDNSGRLLQQGKLPEALAQIEAYLTAHPKDARARFLKGVVLTGQQKSDEAIAVFSALIEDYPELPEPHNNLAVLYASRGEYDKAREQLERALDNRPNYAIAHENLGDVHAKMAARSYARALELADKNPALADKLEALRRLLPEPGAQPQPLSKGKP
ncbi:MAG: tetratricopeptide repeat protein [Burkholderiales bacterium]|nr:tetratricopeptide repeat protein [Burkholderiales bacterium]